MTDPLLWLHECHARIRRFTGGLERMGALDDPTDPRLAPAAEQCARYFREGLSRHAEDEERSLAPRLGAPDLAIDPALAAALERMTAEHVAIDLLLAPLLLVLDDAARGSPVDLPALRALAAPFSTLLLAHIVMEEAVIFPAADALSPADRDAMLLEMRARRDV